MEPTIFFRKYKPYAVITQMLYGVPASITLAQAAIESSWGESSLTTKYKNFFGIKSHGVAGGVIFSSPEFIGGSYQSQDSSFRTYATAYGSFRDHSKFLKQNSRYNSLFKLPITDFEGWATGLKNAGYATSPKYDTDIIKIINSHNLNQVDKIVQVVKWFLIFALILLAVYLFKRFLLPRLAL